MELDTSSNAHNRGVLISEHFRRSVFRGIANWVCSREIPGGSLLTVTGARRKFW